MNTRLTAGALAILLALFCGGATAQDSSLPWQLEFSHQSLKTITVSYEDGSARSVNYLTYTIKNTSDVEASLALHFKAVVGKNPRKQQTLIALPDADAEEFVRRMSRNDKLMNVQQINRHNASGGPGKLNPGETLHGIAVFGEFDREWDVAMITVAGLEPRALKTRVRKYGDAGFTIAHRAYLRHNKAVLAKAGPDADWKDVHGVVQHQVVWRMTFHREGDEFSAQLDPIYLDSEGWDVLADPAPKIVTEFKPRVD
jgi:hypothetical protein